MSDNGEMGIDGGGIVFEDFKVCFSDRQAEADTLFIGDGIGEDGFNTQEKFAGAADFE